MSITFLPSFKEVRPEHTSIFNKYLSAFKPYSDFNLLSLLTWNKDEKNSFCELEGNLIIRINDYLTSDYIYSIIGENDIDKIVKLLLNSGLNLRCVPEEVRNQLKEPELLSPDRDSFDYVVDIQNHSLELSGKKYKSYRGHVKSFFREHENAKLVEIDLKIPEKSDKVVQLVKDWCKMRGFDNQETQENLQRTKTFINVSEQFNTYCLGLEIEKQLIACTLNELVSDDWCMGHFGYSMDSYPNAAYALEHLGTLEMKKKGLKYLNMEQDTGIQGLRTYKMNLAPSFFLKKYASISSDKQESASQAP